MGLWRIELQNTLSDGGAWIRFDNDGSATDLIKCIIGPNNQRCSHEMSFGPFRPRVTYDDALIDHWASIRAMTETFFGCARAAFLTERGKS